MKSTYRSRLESFYECLNADKVPIDKLRQLCFHGGVPDEKGLRAQCWKYLLNYLGPMKSENDSFLGEKRSLYHQFLKTFLSESLPNGSGENGPLEIPQDTGCDHPLNPGQNSQWRSYFVDNEVLMQIDRDCRRIAPDLSFFQMGTGSSNDEWAKLLRIRVHNAQLNSETVVRDRMGLHTVEQKGSSGRSSFADVEEVHWEVVERILFIFYKLNPGQGYVQGMNEVLGPLYYVFANDPDIESRGHAEADAFFCFTNLMGEIRDCFIRSLDESECGVRGQLATFVELLRSVDIHVSTILEQQRIQPQYFAFRWLSLLLSQELPLPELLHIWDVLFSDPNRFRFLLYVCCAMLVVQRDSLLGGDFTSNLRLLQNYPSCQSSVILHQAHDLYARFAWPGSKM